MYADSNFSYTFVFGYTILLPTGVSNTESFDLIVKNPAGYSVSGLFEAAKPELYNAAAQNSYCVSRL